MATKFLYLTATTGDSWRLIAEEPQAAATNTDGWVVGTGSTNHSEYFVGVERAASTFTGTTVPDGTLDTTNFDAFRTAAPYTGTFAAGNWTFTFNVAAVTSSTGQDGRIRFRLIKAAANGSSATEITAAQQQAGLITNVASSPGSESALTFNPGAITLSNQHLFVQVAWERTGAASMSTADVNWRTGQNTTTGTRIATTDFTSIYPQTRSTASGNESANTTTHTVTLPPTVEANDLLLVLMSFDGAPTVTWDNTTHGTWTQVFDVGNGTNKLVCYGKIAAGSEDSGTLSIDTGAASEQSVFRSIAIQGAYTGGTVAQAVYSATATGSDANPNPPTLSPSPGSKDYLWFAVQGNDSTATVSAYPSAGYVSGRFNDLSGGGAGCGLASCRKDATAASDDPGTYTLSGSVAWVAATLAVRPAANEVELSTVAGTGAVGTLKPTISRAITGNAATGAVGTVAASASYSVALTGEVGTGAIGTLSPRASLALSGESASGAAGNLAASVAAVLSGLEATGAEGTLTPEVGISVALTGEQTAGAVGTLAPQVAVALTGESATGAIGTVGAGREIEITGLQASGAVGTLTPQVFVTVAGEAATGAVGGITVSASLSLSGEEAAGAVGTLAASISAAITGQEGTGAVGTVTPEVSGASVALTGEGANGAAGNLGAALSVALAGLQAAGAAGNLAVSGDVSLELAGNGATGAAGLLAPSLSVALAGSEAAGAVGGFGVAVDVASAGNEATGAAGLLNSATAIALTGEAATAAAGIIAASIEKAIQGNAATGYAGDLDIPGVIRLTGTSGAGAIGALAAGVALQLSGIEASGASGSLAASESPAVKGEERDEPVVSIDNRRKMTGRSRPSQLSTGRRP